MKILFDYKIFSLQRYGGIASYSCETSNKISCNKSNFRFITASMCINKHLRNKSKNNKLFGLSIILSSIFGHMIRLLNLDLSWPIVWFIKPDFAHETYYSRFCLAAKSSEVVTSSAKISSFIKKNHYENCI